MTFKFQVNSFWRKGARNYPDRSAGSRCATHSLVWSAAVILAAATTLSTCRTPRRAGRVQMDSAKLVVAVIGLETTATESNAQAPIAFQLSGCTETTTGNVQPDGTILFKSDKFFRDQFCDLKVRALYDSADVRFIGEPGTLYWAKAIKISENNSGQLVSKANLQPMFERIIPRQPGRTFTLQIPVIFSPAPNDAPITASLDCNPRIANVAEYADTNGKPNLSFTFVAESRTDTKFSCKYLWVSAGGIGQKYQGKISEPTLDGFADAAIKLNPVELIAVPLADSATGADINVTTSPGSCASGEVFNTMTRMCEKT